MILKNIIFVGLGGAAGSILRYLFSVILPDIPNGKIPISTLLVNVLGSLIIGVVLGLLSKHHLDDSYWKFLLAVGFCGGFTTFSSFAFENYNMLTNGFNGTAAIYIALSIILCIAAVYTGILLSRLLQ